MAKQRYLKKAPITEAIIDLRLMRKLDVSILPKLTSIKEIIKDSYPESVELKSFSGRFGIKDGKPILPTLSKTEREGYLFKTADKYQIAQFRLDGFTFNRLKPYTRWKEILSEAQRLWKIYLTTASPGKVARIAVRYINKLQLPLPEENMARYLTEPLTIPEGIHLKASSSFCNMVLQDAKLGISANVKQVIEKSVNTKVFTLILDNDVHINGSFDPTDLKIWDLFEQLRIQKNAIFFASITDETARLFE